NNINSNAKTPQSIRQKLEESGYKTNNIIVDITNYVMLTIGQPLHAYDLDCINSPIVVRKAKNKESIELLDGSSKTLNDNLLIIADQNKPLGIAGIMGGISSSITDQTKSIVIESAYFNPKTIMGCPRMLNLHSEASLRFERGVDPTIQIEAIDMFTILLNKIAGGENGPISSKISEEYIPINKTINLRKNKIKKILGITIPNIEILSILKNLKMDIEENEFGYQGWNVKAPPYRFDINDECDLIEEIARIYGYNNIKECIEDEPSEFINESSRLIDKNNLCNILTGVGYSEVINYSFVSPIMNDLNQNKIGQSMDLQNPLSIEMSVMRNSLLPGLINNLMHNLKRQHKNIRLFEVGKIFTGTKNKINEDEKISGLIYGSRNKEQWGYSSELVDYYDMKGHLEVLFESLGISNYISYKKSNHKMLHPGKSGKILFKNKTIGYIGSLCPEAIFDLNLNSEPIVFEIDYSIVSKRIAYRYKEQKYFPSSRRDISILMSEDIEINTVVTAIYTLNIKELKDVVIFDIYDGKTIKPEKKSISLGLIFQAKSRTLTDEEIDKFMININKHIQSNFEIVIRQ
ncbi:MAG: phenylalanine--tRNA ligase subunit beta, partial [Gammaproteobacteria bacterium]|nr:phenylalanine--tRNA ligase subunit beta [Gammaproteobacteria bacterium]